MIEREHSKAIHCLYGHAAASTEELANEIITVQRQGGDVLVFAEARLEYIKQLLLSVEKLKS